MAAWAVFLVWLAGAVTLIGVLRVFGRSAFNNAPPRNSTLSVVHLAGVFLLYIGSAVMAGALNLILWPPPPSATATTSASTATATAPAATTPATLPIDSADEQIRQARTQIIYSLSLLVPTALLLLLAGANVRGGLPGFGLDAAKFWRSLAYGAIGFVIVMPLMEASQIIIELLIAWLHPKKIVVHPVIEMVESPTLSVPWKVGLVLTAVVLAPFCEELFFRGLLQTIFLQPTRTIIGVSGRALPIGRPTPLRRWAVILGAGVLFAGVHYTMAEPNPEQMPLLLLLGAALGYVYERTGSLWASMTLHALFNGFVLATAGLSS